MKRLQYYFKRVVLCLAALLLALLACEGILCAIGYHYVPFAIRVGDGSQDWRLKHAFEDTCFIADPELIWRPKPSVSLFNSHGFRGPELPLEKQPGEFRVVALGDSNTLGWIPGNPPNYHGANWPEYVQPLLAAATKKQVTVINAGVWGYSSFQGVVMLERFLAYQPDIVLVSYGSNDTRRVAVPDDQFNTAIGGTFMQLTRLCRRSPLANLRTVQLLKATRDRLGGASSTGPENSTFRVPLDQYRKNLERIIRRCRQAGVGCILLTRPYVGDSSDPADWKTYAPDYVAATLAVGSEQNVPVVDVYREFRDSSAMFADESHFTEEGHRAAARLIGDAILPFVERNSLRSSGKDRATE